MKSGGKAVRESFPRSSPCTARSRPTAWMPPWRSSAPTSPKTPHYNIETYTPLTPVWTWYVPERYSWKKRPSKRKTANGWWISATTPCTLSSYSLPVDAVLPWSELEPHLYLQRKTEPTARHTPGNLKLPTDRDWGFCLPKNQFDLLPRDKTPDRVVIPLGVSNADPQAGVQSG